MKRSGKRPKVLISGQERLSVWLSLTNKSIKSHSGARPWQVDTHIHHSACMHQKHLLRFIKSKLRKEPDEVVIFRDGKYLTLKEVFESLKLTGGGGRAICH